MRVERLTKNVLIALADSDWVLQSQDPLYELSMLILVAAAYGEQEVYTQVKAQMLQLLPMKQLTSKQAWLLGRLVVASKMINDDESLPLQADLKRYLMPESTGLMPQRPPADFFTAWAWAYLLFDDVTLYSEHRDQLGLQLAAIKSHLDKSSLIWVKVMNLYAYASNDDQERFADAMLHFCDDTGAATMEEAVALVPLEDYRLWLIQLINWSVVRLQADRSLLLPTVTPYKLSGAPEMMAMAFEKLVDDLRSERGYDTVVINSAWSSIGGCAIL